jgi:hypothetical protein
LVHPLLRSVVYAQRRPALALPRRGACATLCFASRSCPHIEHSSAPAGTRSPHSGHVGTSSTCLDRLKSRIGSPRSIVDLAPEPVPEQAGSPCGGAPIPPSWSPHGAAVERREDACGEMGRTAAVDEVEEVVWRSISPSAASSQARPGSQPAWRSTSLRRARRRRRTRPGSPAPDVCQSTGSVQIETFRRAKDQQAVHAPTLTRAAPRRRSRRAARLRRPGAPRRRRCRWRRAV